MHIIAKPQPAAKPAEVFLTNPFQNLLVGNVTYEMLTLLLIYHTDVGTCFLELLGNALPDTLCATCHNGYFVLEIHKEPI